MEHKEFIDKYMKETVEITEDIDKQEIGKFISILFDAWKNGKKVITLGNGGSASTASHFAGDLLKTVANDSSMKEIAKTKGFKAICLNDNSASLTAWINDSGWDMAYSGLLNTLLDEGDVLLLISVHGGSGWSGNLVHAINFAKSRNARVIGLAGFDGGKMKELCDSCIVVPKDSTPHTEGFHSVIQHLVIFRLCELVKEAKNINRREKSKAFFFDRDGILNHGVYRFEEDKNSYHDGAPLTIKELKIKDLALDTVKNVKMKGFIPFIVTNQPDFLKKDIPLKNYEEITAKICKDLELDRSQIFECLHRSESNCNCRKPSPGLLLMAKELHNLNMEESWIIGDSCKDIEVAINAGIKNTIFLRVPMEKDLRAGNQLEERRLEEKGIKPTAIIDSISELVHLI